MAQRLGHASHQASDARPITNERLMLGGRTVILTSDNLFTPGSYPYQIWVLFVPDLIPIISDLGLIRTGSESYSYQIWALLVPALGPIRTGSRSA